MASAVPGGMIRKIAKQTRAKARAKERMLKAKAKAKAHTPLKNKSPMLMQMITWGKPEALTWEEASGKRML